MRSKPTLRLTLILSLLGAGILPMLVSGVIMDLQAANDLERIAYEKLEGDAAKRKAFFESYVTTVIDQNASLAGEPWLAEALASFDAAYETAAEDLRDAGGSLPGTGPLAAFYEREFLGTLREKGEEAVAVDRLLPRSERARALQHVYIADNPHPLGEKDALSAGAAGTPYDALHARYHPSLNAFQKRFDYYDVFLIEPDAGNVVYSVFKEIDYATSLFDGPHRDSGLAEAARRAMRLPAGEVALIDFDRYLPSYGAGASFVASPVYDGERLVGALAFQMPLGRLNAIMGASEGLGETGEALLVGADGLRRSQSRFTEEDTILTERVESPLVAEGVRGGAAELSSASVGLSERTERQAANLEETASSTDELTSTVKRNAENARSANRLAQETRRRAAQSGEVASRAVHAMQDINASSEKIADIIGVVDEIAFQTNLLALNAAVEAARAGEQGRGFAVVASEVRQLAGRSASAAKEIKELIEDSVQKVQDGTGLVQESGTALEDIVGSVASLTEIVGQITVASDEQAVGIEQINQALVHMDGVTQQNTAMVEEATATSRAMNDRAERLSSRIGYFSSGRAAAKAPASPASPASPAAASTPRADVAPAANVVPLTPRAAKADAPPAPAPLKKASGGEDFWDEF